MIYRLLDLNYLDEYFLGDTPSLNLFLELFVASVDADLKVLEMAIKQSNVDATRKTSHKLKSAYRYMGIKILANIFEQIEQSAVKNRNFVEIDVLFQKGLSINLEMQEEVILYLNLITLND